MKVWYRAKRKTLSNVLEEAGTSVYRGADKMAFSNRDVEPTAYNIGKLHASTGLEANVPKIFFVLNDIDLSLVLSWCYRGQGNRLLLKVIISLIKFSGPVVPKVCSADPKRSATGSQRIRGYMSVMVTLKFTYFLIEVLMF